MLTLQELEKLGPKTTGTAARDAADRLVKPSKIDTEIQDERTSRGKKSLDYFHEKSYQALMEKSQIYSQMKSGNYVDEISKNESDASVLPRRPTTDDVLFNVEEGPELMVEVEDEFGRTRQVPQKEAYLYRKFPEEVSEDYEEENQYGETSRYYRERYDNSDSPIADDSGTGRVARPKRVLRGDYIQTSTFKLDEAAAQKLREHAENGEDVSTHYDPTWEIRTKGTGFYNFESTDEKLRRKQMESIRDLRKETEQAQQTRSTTEKANLTPAEVFLQEVANDIKMKGDEVAIGKAGINDEDDPLVKSDFNSKLESAPSTESKVEYERRVNERKKLIERLREKRVQHMKAFVKGDDL